jgi:hypothetical protein
MKQKKESLRGHHQWMEPLLQSGELPMNYKERPDWVLSSVLLDYARPFRGLDHATNESIASFLYDEMGFSPKLHPKGNKFRDGNGGPRGYVFPPLLAMRDRWEIKFGGQWDWHDPSVQEWQPAPKYRTF